MKATDLLKKDHQVVDELFKRIEDTPPSKHPAIFKRIKNELDTHAHIEEKIFYPALKAKGDKELVEITAEGFEEHAQIKKFLRETARTSSTDTREAKLKVLIEDTRHHVKEEENEMFPMVEDQFSSEELEKLGERMEAEKKKFQKAKRIPARREEPKGAIASVIEKAKELVAAAVGSNAEAAGGKRSSGTAKGRGAAAGAKSAKGSGGGGSSKTPKASSSRSNGSKSNGRSRTAGGRSGSASKNGAAKSSSRKTSPKTSKSARGSKARTSGSKASAK